MAGFFALREIALIEVALDRVLVDIRRISPWLGLLSLCVYALGVGTFHSNTNHFSENPSLATAFLAFSLVLGIFAMNVRPASLETTGRPFLSPIVLVLGRLCILILEPLLSIAEEMRRKADERRREREKRNKERLEIQARQAREAETRRRNEEEERRRMEDEETRLRDKLRREEQARIKLEAHIRSGRVRENCSEELLLKCNYCGSESNQTVWTTENGVCSDCGEGSPLPQGTCTRCHRPSEASAGERSCHSIAVYQETGKILF